MMNIMKLIIWHTDAAEISFFPPRQPEQKQPRYILGKISLAPTVPEETFNLKIGATGKKTVGGGVDPPPNQQPPLRF